MRFIIIGLSIIFFTLSAIITFKALELQVHKTSYQDNRKKVTFELNNVIKKLTEDQDTNRAREEDLQATIAQLEDKLKTKEEAIEKKDVTLESNNAIKKLTEDQNKNRALVADLQATIAQLEDKLKTKEEAIERKDLTLESNNVIKKLTEDQNTNRALVANLQATIAQLQDKLKRKDEAIESIKSTVVENRPRTLMVLGGGTFRSGQDTINDIAFSTIENFIREIAAYPDSRVLIEGHTDNIPAGKLHGDNMDLSLRRARAIAKILVSHGISPSRISVIGYGDARPIDSNDTEEGRAKNRRVEVKLMPKEGKN